MSKNKPNTTTNIISETSHDEYDPKILRHDTQQDTLHFHPDDHIEQFQNQEPQQLHTVQNPPQGKNTFKNIPDPSETSTIQNASKISDIPSKKLQSLTVTNDSNILQILLRNITNNILCLQNQNNTNINTNQDKTIPLPYLHQILK